LVLNIIHYYQLLDMEVLQWVILVQIVI